MKASYGLLPAGALLLALSACQTTAPTAQAAAVPGDSAGSAGPGYCETVPPEPRRHGAVERALLARRQALTRRRAARRARRPLPEGLRHLVHHRLEALAERADLAVAPAHLVRAQHGEEVLPLPPLRVVGDAGLGVVHVQRRAEEPRLPADESR